MVFDDTVDMARQARFAMEFCAIESCGKCTPCRIGSARGVEVIDRIVKGDRRDANAALLAELCDTMRFGSLCALGGFVPYPGDERADPFPRRFRAGREGGVGADHVSHSGNRLRHPGLEIRRRLVTLTIDGLQVTVPEGTSIMRAAMEAGIKVPKLCAYDMVEASARAALCLVEIEGRAGTPASCTTPVAEGIKVTTQNQRLGKHPPQRDGALHLRPPARLPDLLGERQLRVAGHGRRGRACARCATAMHGENHLDAEKDESNPYFTFDPAKCIVCSRCVRACEEVQGTFALTIDGRGFESQGRGRDGRGISSIPNASRAAPACRPVRPRP